MGHVLASRLDGWQTSYAKASWPRQPLAHPTADQPSQPAAFRGAGKVPEVDTSVSPPVHFRDRLCRPPGSVSPSALPRQDLRLLSPPKTAEAGSKRQPHSKAQVRQAQLGIPHIGISSVGRLYQELRVIPLRLKSQGGQAGNGYVNMART